LKVKQAHILVAVLLWTAAGFAQGRVSVESRVDRAKINIGDVIKYTVIITHDPDVKLERPSPGKNLGQFEIREYQVAEPKKVQNQLLVQTDYLISTFDVGEFEIPPLQVFFRTAQDTLLHQLNTETIKITVASLNPNEKGDIRDIKEPMTPPRDWARIIVAISAAVIVLALLGLGWWYYQRRKAGAPLLALREKPLRPAHELALEALAALQQSDLLATGQIKGYFIQLSEILRKYVEARYFIDAMEMTTGQVIAKMQTDHLAGESITSLQELLQLSDLVKFAKHLPAPEVQQGAVPQAVAFVESTQLVLSELMTPSPESQVTAPLLSEKEA
jgi:hypothetical protein